MRSPATAFTGSVPIWWIHAIRHGWMRHGSHHPALLMFRYRGGEPQYGMTNAEALILRMEGSAVHDIASFYDEINRVFMSVEDWQLAHSLDALDDMLYGGYGVLAGHADATLIWHDIEHARNALGVAATRAWLQAKLDGSGTFNARAITDQLQALDAGDGQTYFQIVMEIFAAHPSITVESR